MALAWAVRSGNVLAIPKAATHRMCGRHRLAADLLLTGEDVVDIDGSFSPPKHASRLEML